VYVASASLALVFAPSVITTSSLDFTRLTTISFVSPLRTSSETPVSSLVVKRSTKIVGLPPLTTGCFDAVLFPSVNDAITTAASTINPAVIMIQRGNLLSRFGGSVGGFSVNDVPAAETVCALSSILVPPSIACFAKIGT